MTSGEVDLTSLEIRTFISYPMQASHPWIHMRTIVKSVEAFSKDRLIRGRRLNFSKTSVCIINVLNLPVYLSLNTWSCVVMCMAIGTRLLTELRFLTTDLKMERLSWIIQVE